MPITRQKGLGQLGGFSSLSKEEQDLFMQENASKIANHNYDPSYINRLYKNQQYVARFGMDSFRAKSKDERDAEFRTDVIWEAARDKFGNDDNFATLNSELDEDGWLELLNSNYTGTVERKKRLNEGILRAKELAKDYDAAIDNPYTDAFYTGITQLGKTDRLTAPYNDDKDLERKDNEIAEDIFAKVQKRREEQISPMSNDIYAKMLQTDSEGGKSLAEYYQSFDELASGKDSNGNNVSPHYAAFKNSRWLEDYTDEEKLKDYAKYIALKALYGEGVANRYLDRSIQDRIAEAQDWSFTGNTLKGVATTIWSDLGSNIALVGNIGRSVEEIGILNEGKDPSKPIYDENGNVVDYEWNEAWVSNPAYWNNVYKYNTFMPTNIKSIVERGGISEDVNVREFGYTPSFASWDTVEEAFKQSGHFVAFGIESALAGGLGKVAGTGFKAAMKGIGMTEKAIANAAKVGNITNDLFVALSGGASAAQMEAMGTFEEQIQSAKERIQQEIGRKMAQYANSIDYTTDAAKAEIEDNYQKLRLQEERRLLTMERAYAIPQADEILKQQAVEMYRNRLLGEKYKELENLHRKDMEEARNAATTAYATNFVMDWVKEAPFDLAIQKFKFAKGSIRGAFDNAGIAENIVADEVTGGIKRAGQSLVTTKNLWKEAGKQIAGGFADEYLDGINASFSNGVGSNEFNNYINRTYNPEAYNAAAEGILGNLLAGLSEGTAGLIDRENIYEGAIGAVSPVAAVNVNVNSVFHPADWKALIKGVDEYGAPLNRKERAARLVTNPLLSTYADLKAKDRAIDRSVEDVNRIISLNKDKLNDAARIISTLDDYSSPMNRVLVDEGHSANELLDSKDNKLFNAFTLMDVLNSLESVEGGRQSALYQQVSKTLDGLANGTLSDAELNEEVDAFLADKSNKSVLEKPNARDIAAERLQKNAKYLMDTREKINEVRNTLAKSVSMRGVDPRLQTALVYNIVASQDYAARLNTLEDELGISKTDADAIYTPDFSVRYGTAKAAESALKVRQKSLDGLNKQKKETQEEIDAAERKIAEINRRLQNISGGEAWKKAQEEKKKNEELRDSNRFLLESLREQEAALNKEMSELGRLSVLEDDREFTAEQIMSLDARDRAEVLNPDNEYRFNAQQRFVIAHVRNKLLQKDPDALRKISDAGTLATRIADIASMQKKITDNSKLASVYLDTVEILRANNPNSLERLIHNAFDAINKAYLNRYTSNSLKLEILKRDPKLVELYMQYNAGQVDDIRPFYEMSKLCSAMSAYLENSDASDDTKKALEPLLDACLSYYNTVKEVTDALERLVDAEGVDADLAALVNDMLSAIEQNGYLRDAAVVEERNKKKAREEEQKKQEEEAKAKAEAEAKAAAEAAKAAAENAADDVKPVDNSLEGAIDLNFNGDGSVSDAPIPPIKNGILVDSFDSIDKDKLEAGQVYYTVTTDKQGYTKIKLKRVGVTTKGKFSLNSAPFLDDSAVDMFDADFFTTDDGEQVYEKENIQLTEIRVSPEGKLAGSVTVKNVGGGYTHNIGVKFDSNPAERLADGQTTRKERDYLEKNVVKETETVETPETPAGEVKETKDNSFIVEEKWVTKGGRVVTEEYKGHKDSDGVIKAVPTRSGIKVTHRQLLDDGFTAEDILGPRSDYNSESLGTFEEYLQERHKTDISEEERKREKEAYDKLKGQYDEMASDLTFKIGRVYISKDGVLVVEDSLGEIPPITGDKAERILQQFAPGLKAQIDRLRGQSTQQNPETSVNIKEGHDDTLGDYVSGESLSVEEQMDEVEETVATVEPSDLDPNVASTEASKTNDRSERTLAGNIMSEYKPDALEEHKLVHKEGEKPNDGMSQYYAWLRNAGVKMQNIIDDELPKILAKDPHTKVRFARVRVANNATHDNYMQKSLLLVVDYTSDVAGIHKESNGGVIESAGKKYLIIGTVGARPENKERFKLYDRLMNAYDEHSFKLMNKAYQWFEQKDASGKPIHASERFYVDSDLSTEVVPGSMIPGFIANQGMEDEGPKRRRITELLDGPEKDVRNPHNLELDKMGWLIQKRLDYAAVKTGGMRIMPPQNQLENAGRVFALVPAGNGRLVPIKIDALHYNSEHFNKDSELYKELQQLLLQLVAPRYEDRYAALMKLFEILNLDEKGHNILLSKDGKAVTLVNNAEGANFSRTFRTEGAVDTTKFFKLVEDWNPRINVTLKVLTDPELLKKYDEAGALMTDAIKLGTFGVSYNVWGIDEEGKTMKPQAPENPEPRIVSGSDYLERNKVQVVYGGSVQYTYYRDTGKYFLNGKEITDEKLLEGLEYSRKIYENGISPASTVGNWNYYIISEGENPEVVRRSTRTNLIDKLSREDALKVIEDARREKTKDKMSDAIDIALSLEEKQNGPAVDTSLFGTDSSDSSKPSGPSITPTSAALAAIAVSTTPSSNPTITFDKLATSVEHRKAVRKRIREVYSDAPDSVSELKTFLKDKGVNVDTIDASEDGIQAWLNDLMCHS